MTSDITDQEPDLLFRLTHKEYVSGQPQWSMPRQFTEAYMLLVVEAGEGELTADERQFSLARGQLYLFSPSTLIEITSSRQAPLGLYLIKFQALRESEQTDKTVLFSKTVEAAGFPCTGQLPEQLFAGVLVAVEPLCRCSSDRMPSGMHQTYRLFYQALAVICEPNSDWGRLDASEAIDRVITYMNEYFHDPISRGQLAAIAGMSPWHFSHKFKEATGLSPTAMLESIRIRKAREHLLASVCGVRDVAGRVGYRDEAHFRGKFKEHTGLSPTMFLAKRRDNIAVLSYHYAAHLLTLQVVPLATYVDRDRESHRDLYHDAIPFPLKRVKQMNEQDWDDQLQALAGIKPDVILCDELVHEAVKPYLQKVAPLVTIPWLEMTWRGHFREIASFLGKRREADRWLSAYDRKAEHASKLLQAKRGQERVTVLHIDGWRLLVYGRRNGGAVLYEDLHLTPAHDVLSIAVCKQIDGSQLGDYDCDRLFIVVDPDRESRLQWEELRRSPNFVALRAVQEGNVHLVREVPWLEYSPYAHDMMLDEVLSLSGAVRR